MIGGVIAGVVSVVLHYIITPPLHEVGYLALLNLKREVLARWFWAGAIVAMAVIFGLNRSIHLSNDVTEEATLFLAAFNGIGVFAFISGTLYFHLLVEHRQSKLDQIESLRIAIVFQESIETALLIALLSIPDIHVRLRLLDNFVKRGVEREEKRDDFKLYFDNS